jgi:uncharacterized protein (TIGR00266 family)
MSKSLLRFEITGGEAFAAVKIFLDKPGQQIVAEGGAMIYMSGGVTMSTKSSGGLMKGLKRTFSGESMFQNYFELDQGISTGYVTFSPGVPGSIVHLHLSQGEDWTLSQGAYIAGTPSVEVSTKRGGLKQMFGGEGFFLTDVKTQAEGDVWIGGYGFIERHELSPGEELVVDNGVMMAYQSHMETVFSKIGGKKSFLLGGEGVVIRYKGPGIVYTQNREIGALAGLLSPYFPKSR